MGRRFHRGGAGVLLAAALVGAAPARAAEPLITVRVLPQAVATNAEPFRLGLQAGFLEGPKNWLRAERLAPESGEAEPQASLTFVSDANTGRRRFAVAAVGERPAGVSFTTAALRKGVAYTARVCCRRDRGKGRLTLFAEPVGGGGEAYERTVSVKADAFEERTFELRPQTDGAHRCVFRLAPGAAMTFASFSLMPDDAEQEWDPQVIEALRTVGPGTLRWPVEPGLGFYNWYDGVGPRALRKAVSPSARPEDGHDFGTVEFAAFCRRVGARPLIRVPLWWPGCGDARVAGPEEGAALAAEWVAYCNACDDTALAELRARHGHGAALEVRAWELAPPPGLAPDGALCRAYARAMRGQDPTIRVGVDLEGADGATVERVLREAGGALDFVSCSGAEAAGRVEAYNRASHAQVRCWATRLAGLPDRYVAEVLRRQERREVGSWYEALSLACAALESLQRGGAEAACVPVGPEQVLLRAPYAKHMVAETGLMLALFNRFPAKVPLRCEGGPAGEGEPFAVRAAWTEDDTALVAFVYNSRPEQRKVLLDLAALRRRFVFWTSEQLAADLAAARDGQPAPVVRKLKAGSALTQAVLCEAAPASLTRIVVKE